MKKIIGVYKNKQKLSTPLREIVIQKRGDRVSENQNIEWKESWRDEYLKWICGFANAQGGKIYIGKRDDGTIIGVRNSKKLLEDIPNKIQNKLGIVADVM